MALDSHVLVVDDDGASRNALGAMLTSAGHRATLLPDGAEAIRYLETQPVPRILLLALTLPDPDGYAVLRHVRTRAGLAELPVVVLMDVDSDAEIARAFASGADDYVKKPCRSTELLARLRVQLRMRDVVAQLERREFDQLQSLRDQTEESRFARVEAEQRVQLFQRYAGFFESAADGMVVIDRTGRVLFANPRAREITGANEAELTGQAFESLLAPGQHELAARLMRGFQAGIYPRGVDLQLAGRNGRAAIANVSFSSVLHEDDAVLFTFRDVTLERRTAVELQQTKEFLESVIDSSVDAIVSADLEGTVILFNRAAARVFGYNPPDVIGKLNVEKLYPPGVAREVMRRIRDPELSGYGRLEDYRVDMLGADNSSIPVLLSASFVVENGRPVGSLGIFTDLREELRIQGELERAHEELKNREKESLIAELAGAAAHELNQPLTSVIGYAQLLARQLEQGSTLHRSAEVIISEAERMADIVRKVGSITKYETKSYVGEARILDLERASDTEGESEGS